MIIQLSMQTSKNSPARCSYSLLSCFSCSAFSLSFSSKEANNNLFNLFSISFDGDAVSSSSCSIAISAISSLAIFCRQNVLSSSLQYTSGDGSASCGTDVLAYNFVKRVCCSGDRGKGSDDSSCCGEGMLFS